MVTPIRPERLRLGDEVRVLAPSTSFAISGEETRGLANKRFPTAYWVVESALLAGQYPLLSPDRGSLDALLGSGVTAFLDLTELDEEGLLPYADELDGVRHRRMAIPDFGVPSLAEMHATVAQIDRWIAEGEVVYVHCHGGIGRTGTVVACYLVANGVTPESALDDINARRSTTPNGQVKSPETREQADFVETYSASVVPRL